MKDRSQISDTVLLVRPACFGFHAEAARSNAFAANVESEGVAAAAQAEFAGLHGALEQAGVRCLVLDDTPDPPKPDAVFPNNWVSFHGDGTIIFYPMANQARRLERRGEALLQLLSGAGFEVRRTIDLTGLEERSEFLEGTGSLVLDRRTGRAFASPSARTTMPGVAAFTEATGWNVYVFDAAERHGRPVYHTNVLFSLHSRFAILCEEAVAPADRAALIDSIEASGRTVIRVEFDQMERFACNVLELRGRDGAPLIALSDTARDCLDAAQRRQLEELGGELVAVPIPTIEHVGGGSVRCMIADVHLPRKGLGAALLDVLSPR